MTIRYKKPVIICLILLLCSLALSACAAGKGGDTAAGTEASTDASVPAETTAGPDFQEIIAKYQKQYGTDKYYSDYFLKQKCMFLTSDSIVVVLAVPGAEITESVPYQSVARIETASVAGFVTLTIFDKANKQTTFNLSAGEADAVIALLNEKTN